MNRHTFDHVAETAAAIQELRGPAPRVGVILGSGLGAFADGLADTVSRPYGALPHFPESAVPGHAGRLVLGRVSETPVAVMQGRVHAYEGWTMDEVAFGARVLCRLGVKLLVVTNAAGGIHPEFRPGDLMRITDHLNLTGRSPLTGPNDSRLGERFPDMSNAYDDTLGELLERAAAGLDVTLRRGVYAAMPGPAYETPAEIRMLRALGADAVGMSTVPEVLAARHMRVPVVGLSVITNHAAGLGQGAPLTHAEVKEVADRVASQMVGLLGDFVPRADARLAPDVG